MKDQAELLSSGVGSLVWRIQEAFRKFLSFLIQMIKEEAAGVLLNTLHAEQKRGFSNYTHKTEGKYSLNTDRHSRLCSCGSSATP